MATNGHGPQSQTQHTWLTRGRLAIAGALLVLAGAVSAVVGLPFGSNGSNGGVPLDSVVALDPGTGQILATTPVGAGPAAVAVGAGSAWVGNTTDRSVSRLDAQTGDVQAAVAIGVYPSDLVVGKGAVYVASGPLGQLVTIHTANDAASNPQTVGQACGTVVQSVAVGAGSVWLACEHTPSAVRIPVGGGTAVPLGYTGHVSALAFGNGALWLVDSTRRRLVRLDPATNRPATTEFAVGAGPVAVTVGFGSEWVANHDGNTVTRVQAGHARTIPVGKQPVDVSAGEGAVWVANASGSVSRIDPATNRVTLTVPLHNPAAGIAAGAGAVWVAVSSG